MHVASIQASQFVRTDGRSRALDGLRLARRSGVAPGAGNSTSWLGNWGSRLEKLLQLKTMGLTNECPACWGQQAWLGVTTSSGRVSAQDPRGVPEDKVDPGSVLGQNYLLETEATLLGWYHPAGWGTQTAHDLKKALLDWGRKVTASDRTGALKNRPLPHRIWGQQHNTVSPFYNRPSVKISLYICAFPSGPISTWGGWRKFVARTISGGIVRRIISGRLVGRWRRPRAMSSSR